MKVIKRTASVNVKKLIFCTITTTVSYQCKLTTKNLLLKGKYMHYLIDIQHKHCHPGSKLMLDQYLFSLVMLALSVQCCCTVGKETQLCQC